MEYIAKNAGETQELGRSIGSSLKGGEIITLFGEMGAGKTTFVQGLAKGLGVKAHLISPTFIIVRRYEVHNSNVEAKNLYHVDLYRLEENVDREISELGLTDLWGRPENIFVIEWSEKLSKVPSGNIKIDIKKTKEDERAITLT